MKTIFTDTLRAFEIGQYVSTPSGYGFIKEIRDNCLYPIFVIFESGNIDAFYQNEIFDL